MAQVRITDPENFEKSLKYWKRQCIKEGIIEEVRKRECFISKSQKKRQKRKAQQRKQFLNKLKQKKFY